MYTTHLHDEKICNDWEKQQMYVEYEEPVAKHIDKIYLSPGAAKYQDHFRILLDQGSGKSKVRISQNPFRNKEWRSTEPAREFFLHLKTWCLPAKNLF